MEQLMMSEIAKALKVDYSGEDCEVLTITTNSKLVTEKSVFVALKGDKFDGNDYAKQFLDEGGCGVIVSRDIGVCHKSLIVDDTKIALGEIAKYYRSKFDVSMIGITGSVGKTSTKDIIANILEEKYNVTKTQGNFNNEIGLPLCTFNIDSKTEVAVLEMGMNNLGEISRLSQIAKPNIAVITNIGTAHIGMLGSQQGILRAKLEILDGLQKDGVLILNGDDPLLWELRGNVPCKALYYGINNQQCDILATDIVLGSDKSKFSVKLKDDDADYKIIINVIGMHHIYNSLAGILCGLYHKMKMVDIIRGISCFENSSMRQTMWDISGVTFISDCYNASSTSMESSITVLSQKGVGRRKIAVLGDILEMGEFSKHIHRQVGEFVAEREIDILITVGNDSEYICKSAVEKGVDGYHFPTNNEAAEFLLSIIKQGDVLLFKASRGMKLEEIINIINDNLS